MNTEIDDPTTVLDPPDVDLTPTEPTPAMEPEPEPTPTPAPAFDPAALSAAIAEGLRAGQPKPEPKALTPEEAKKLLNVWEPTDEWLQRYDNIETRKAAIAEMHQGQLRQFDTVAQLRLREQQEAFDQRLTPIQQYWEQQEAVARETRFNSMFPDLAKPEMKSLVNAAISGLVAQKSLVGKSEGEIFKAIGSTVEAYLKQANPAFKLTPGGSTPPGKPTGHGLRPTTSGSGGGGGKGTTGDAPKATALKFL